MLTPAHNVPHVLDGEVLGLAGTKCWPVLADPCDRLVLWAVGRDMTAVQLDLAGVRALIELLADAERRMQAG